MGTLVCPPLSWDDLRARRSLSVECCSCRHSTIAMYLNHSFLTVCVASFAAGAVFHRAPYSNVTLTTKSSVSASTLAPVLPATSSRSVSSLGTGISSDHEILRPTDAASTGPLVSSVLPNATLSDDLNTTSSQGQYPSLATPEIHLPTING